MRIASKKLTRSTTPKFTEADFQRLQLLADRDGKRLGEWCRDILLEAINQGHPSPSQHALLAEIAATQDIVIGLLCALERDGNLTTQKAQEIVDAAHSVSTGTLRRC